MPHDGQDRIETPAATLLDDLLTLTAKAVPVVEALQHSATAALRDCVVIDGRVSASALEAEQHAAHGLSWLATYTEALRQMQAWADKLTAEGTFGEVEALLHQIAFGEYLAQIKGGIPMSQTEILRLSALGIDAAPLDTPAIDTLIAKGNSPAARAPCRPDARAQRRDHGGPLWAGRRVGDDPRAVPPLQRRPGRAARSRLAPAR